MDAEREEGIKEKDRIQETESRRREGILLLTSDYWIRFCWIQIPDYQIQMKIRSNRGVKG